MHPLKFQKILVTRFGGTDQLQVIEATLEAPASGFARVKINACGVGYTDVMARRGEYIYQRRLPFTPGYELAGEVIDFKPVFDTPVPAWLAPGARVVACLPKMGAYSGAITVPIKYLVPIPKEISFQMAAALSLNYLTALAMFEKSTHLSSGDVILIQGAAGGVGEALCQLGRSMGLRLYGTASERDFQRLQAYGVKCINYKTEDFETVLRQREPGGMSAVFDHMGGKYYAKGYRALAPGGTLVSYAFAGRPGHILGDTILGALANQLLGIVPFKHTRICSLPKLIAADPTWYQHGLANLLTYAADGTIAPRLGQTFRLSEAAEAQRLLENHQGTGKLVLLP